MALLPSWRSLLAAVALVGVAAGLYAAARGTAMFAVREVRVEGAPPALARAVREELAPVLDGSLVTLDGAEVLARVEAIPAVRAASYDRAFPNTLVVSVVPERPAAVLRRGSEAWLLSERGRVLRPVPAGKHKRLPRIWTPKAVTVEVGAVVGDPDVRRAVRVLPPARAERLPVRIRTVRGRAGDVAFVLVGGLELRLGDPTDVRLKLAVAREILPLLAAPSGGGPTYLDVSVPERPVAGQTLNPEVEVEG